MSKIVKKKDDLSSHVKSVKNKNKSNSKSAVNKQKNFKKSNGNFNKNLIKKEGKAIVCCLIFLRFRIIRDLRKR